MSVVGRRLILVVLPVAVLAPPPALPWTNMSAAQAEEPDADRLAALLDRLDKNAPALETLQARYIVQCESIVGGQSSSYQQQGQLLIRPDRVCVIREVLPGVPEMQLVYEDGYCYRYFPFTRFGHRMLSSSVDKMRTDFARYWRPYLAHVSPNAELGTVGPLTAPSWSDMPGHSPILADHDQDKELATRPVASKLEYWGPRPDMAYYISDTSSRIERVVVRHYRAKDTQPPQAYLYETATAELQESRSFNGVVIPTKLSFKSQRERENEPYRRSTLTLHDIRVNESPTASSCDLIWPKDTIFLDAELQDADFYLPTSDSPTSMIMLADVYLGNGDRSEGARWVARYRASLGDGVPTPPELGHLARLMSHLGEAAEADTLYRDGFAEVSREAASDEELLVRYYAEYGQFVARSHGPTRFAEAAALLRSKLEELNKPLAMARLAGHAAFHYTRIKSYAQAEALLQTTMDKIGDDPEAKLWLQGCQARLDTARLRDAWFAARRAKRTRMGDLDVEISRLAGRGSSADQEKLKELRKELARLRSRP